MHWVMIVAKDVKTQFVPLPLLEGVFEEMESRGVSDQQIQSVEVGWLEAAWPLGFLSLRRSIMEVPFDGIILRFPADSIEEIIYQLKKSFPRWAKSQTYIKLHSVNHTLCLLSEQRDDLVGLLESRVKEAYDLVCNDWRR